MHTVDELALPEGCERHRADTSPTADSRLADACLAGHPVPPAMHAASSVECARLLQRFVRHPVETAIDARVDSIELMRLYRIGVDRRIAEAGVARQGAGPRPLATLGADMPCNADVSWDAGHSRPIRMGIAALSTAVTVTSIVSAALSAISSLLRHKPV